MKREKEKIAETGDAVRRSSASCKMHNSTVKSISENKQKDKHFLKTIDGETLMTQALRSVPPPAIKSHHRATVLNFKSKGVDAVRIPPFREGKQSVRPTLSDWTPPVSRRCGQKPAPTF